MPKKGDSILAILSAIAQTAGRTLSSMTPGLFIRESMYYKDLRMAGHDPKKLERAFKNLRQRNLIYSDSEKIRFTQKGRQWLTNSYRRYFMFDQPAADKKWRVVMFDIPREHNKSRDKLRSKLKLWGFYKLQQSVFVAPYKCEEEIAEICQKLNISDYVDIVLADSPGFREAEIRSFFNTGR